MIADNNMDSKTATLKNLVDCWKTIKAPNGRTMRKDDADNYVVEGVKNGSTVVHYRGRSFTQAHAHLMKEG